MFTPMALAAIYTSALIFGPAFIIVLALCIALLVRFSSFKMWIGAAMLLVGIIELSLVPFWVFWVSFIGLCTSIIGIAVLSGVLFSRQKRAWVGIVFVVVGFVGVVVTFLGFSGWGFFGFAFWTALLASGAAGAAFLMQERKRVKAGLVVAAFGFLMILIGILAVYLPLVLFVGLVVVFAGISSVVSGLPYWVAQHSVGNTVHRLRKSLYVLLLVVVLSSSIVLSLRETHVLREELYDTWTLTTSADTTIRGVVVGVYLHYEVDNNGYSYHIFPALLIVNVTEVVKAGQFWTNLTEANENWVNTNMTVAYDKPNVPTITVGQRVEVSGYYNMLVEEPNSYSNKLVIAAEINGSYITVLS